MNIVALAVLHNYWQFSVEAADTLCVCVDRDAILCKLTIVDLIKVQHVSQHKNCRQSVLVQYSFLHCNYSVSAKSCLLLIHGGSVAASG